MSIAVSVFEITYPGVAGEYESFSIVRSGLTAGKVKHEEYLQYSDAYPDTSYLDYLQLIKCKKIGESVPGLGEEAYPAQARIDIVNQLLREIGSRGRRILYYAPDDRYAAFHWAGGQLWLTDYYTDMPMIMAPGDGQTYEQKHRFSSGGTMWGLVNDFKDFILGDDNANGNNGYCGLYCTHWAYPEEDMQAIRQRAVELGYLKVKEAVQE